MLSAAVSHSRFAGNKPLFKTLLRPSFYSCSSQPFSPLPSSSLLDLSILSELQPLCAPSPGRAPPSPCRFPELVRSRSGSTPPFPASPAALLLQRQPFLQLREKGRGRKVRHRRRAVSQSQACSDQSSPVVASESDMFKVASRGWIDEEAIARNHSEPFNSQEDKMNQFTTQESGPLFVRVRTDDDGHFYNVAVRERTINALIQACADTFGRTSGVGAIRCLDNGTSIRVDEHVQALPSGSLLQLIYVTPIVDVSGRSWTNTDSAQNSSRAPVARYNSFNSRRRIQEGGLEAQFSALEKQGWKLLRDSIATYNGNPVGTIAANDPDDADMVNYDQVFVRDFVSSAVAFLLAGEPDIVRNFLDVTLNLQLHEKDVDGYSAGAGLMPASFKIAPGGHGSNPLTGADAEGDVVLPDFGGHAIARVSPVDSALWWMYLLRVYGRITGDLSLEHSQRYQAGMRVILGLYLKEGFDTFPTLLVSDGACMMDRRMGIHGHPLEIQSLFYTALRCAEDMLIPQEGEQFEELLFAVKKRKNALQRHVREHYWIDRVCLNRIYRFQTEEYSLTAQNKFNIYPEQIPLELLDWIPEDGGYLAGNLQPGHMDFRFFSLGNLWAVNGALTTSAQATAMMNLYVNRWEHLVGHMPLKIAYPALKGEEWRIITGGDPKNTEWSYHNGGNWPTLMWMFTLACLKCGRRDLAERAVEIAERKLAKDKWAEYYDGLTGNFVGKRAHLYQTWTIAGYLTSKLLLLNPDKAQALWFD